MPCSPGMRGCRRDCLHRDMVSQYHDQRDARDALRETEMYMQHEDVEFEKEFPPVHFKQWLKGFWRKE